MRNCASEVLSFGPSRNDENGRKLPDGQITSPCADRLSSPSVKNILIFRNPKSVYIHDRPASLEGRFAIVTNVRRDAVDADVASDEST